MSVANAHKRLTRLISHERMKDAPLFIRLQLRLIKKDLDEYLTHPPRTTAGDIAQLQLMVDHLRKSERDLRLARELLAKKPAKKAGKR